MRLCPIFRNISTAPLRRSTGQLVHSSIFCPIRVVAEVVVAINYLIPILHNNNFVDILGQLNEQNAKLYVEFLSFVLSNRLLPDDDDLYRRAKYLLVELCGATKTLPRSLYLDPQEITVGKGPSFEFGGSAEVHAGNLRGNKVVLKRVRIREVNKDFCREALICNSLSHERVLPFLGVYIDPSLEFISLVSPYMSNGTLCDWRARTNPTSSEIQSRILAVAKGIQYIHHQGIVHGDIKGSNIFLDDNLQIKIADLGLARLFDDATASRFQLSIHFAAPELLYESDEEGKLKEGDGEEQEQEERGLVKRTSEMDVYAFGCLFYQIHFGRLPFGKRSGYYSITDRVSRGQRPRKLSSPPVDPRVWRLIEGCWHQQSAQRPTMDEVIQIMESWH